ncbi:hypothetical protein [Microbispora sp. ATCC PTA-5024]|uniref:hypothetical protein n=1 Tax=Microbispora sp. ATCC PTA-5024 TaxID=316330 RepID=UPI0012EE577B|nr:hypothetical protein [Microbispora sp. ATCC PTA-5024]
MFAGTSGEITIPVADTTAPIQVFVVNRLASGEQTGELSHRSRPEKYMVGRGDAQLFTAVGLDPEGLKNIEMIGHGELVCADEPPTILFNEVVLVEFPDRGVSGTKGYQTRYASSKVSKESVAPFLAVNKPSCIVRTSVCARATNFGGQKLQSSSYVVDFGGPLPKYEYNVYRTCTGQNIDPPPNDRPWYGGSSPTTIPPIEPSQSPEPYKQFEFCLTGPGGKIHTFVTARSESEAREELARTYGGYTIATGPCPPEETSTPTSSP